MTTNEVADLTTFAMVLRLVLAGMVGIIIGIATGLILLVTDNVGRPPDGRMTG